MSLCWVHAGIHLHTRWDSMGFLCLEETGEHRSTQNQPSSDCEQEHYPLSCPAGSCPAPPHRALPCPAPPRRALPHRALSCPTVPCPAPPCPGLPHRALPCPTVLYPALPRPAPPSPALPLSCPTVPCRAVPNIHSFSVFLRHYSASSCMDACFFNSFPFASLTLRKIRSIFEPFSP